MTYQANGNAHWQRFETLAKRGATSLLARPPVTNVLRRRATAHGTVSVLVYHTLGADGEDFDAWTVIEREKFRTHIQFLQSHYDIVSLDEALQSFGSAAGRPKAVLTFDDGEHGLYCHLLPIVEEFGIPVTIYVATRHIETAEPYWFDAIMNALQSLNRLEIDLSSFGLPPVVVGESVGTRNWMAIRSVLEHLKAMPEDRRSEAVEAVLSQASSAHKRRFTPMRPLAKSELVDIARHPLVTIGAHSHCHSLLDRIDLDRAESSVRTSVLRLREWTGQEVKHFAYPNGNFNQQLESAMARIGFQTAAAADGGLWRAGSDLFALPRVPVGRYDTAQRLELRLVGI